MKPPITQPPNFSLALLGAPCIALEPGGEVSLTNRKALALLAYLAVESKQAHSRDALLGLLWPDMSDADARNNLRVTWSQLRAKLGDGFLLSNRIEMQFDLHSAYRLDVAEFNNLLTACAQHAHSRRNECAECQARLAYAVELYRGDFLAGFFLEGCAEFGEWLMVQRERLRQQMLDVLHEVARHHEQASRWKLAEGYVRQLLQIDPLREDAHRQLMQLLQRQDQRTAALTQFENCKRLLADELGVQPDPETVSLAAHIRSGSTPSSQTQSAHKHNLPAPLTRFFGREKDIAALAWHLTEAQTPTPTPTPRLITLTGSGGVGKTRLAVQAAYEVAQAFADGVCWVELAPLSDSLSVARAVAAALELREQAGLPMPQLLSHALHDKQLLLVMDNCEHVLSACSALITQLLAAAPKLKVLATSRTPLRVAGEVVRRVASLSAPNGANGAPLAVDAAMTFEAVQLFVNRAAAAHGNFVLQPANANAVAQICNRLDGIPLALELAAARLKAMPIDALAQRLDSRFKLLTSNSHEALPRHRTLQALVGWSYDLLNKAEQVLLRQLAVFVGGWRLEAAEAVCDLGDGAGNPVAVLDHLMALVDNSLVVFGSDPQQERYAMLETIRQFAAEQLKQSGEELETQARHARYYAQFVAEAATHAHSVTHQQALDRVEVERDNVLSALSWAIGHEADLALSLAANLGGRFDFWEMRGHFEEGRQWLGRLLEVTQATASIARARVLREAARVESAKPNYPQALAYAKASVQLSEDLGDAFGVIDARLQVAGIIAMQGDLSGGQVLVQACLAEAEQLGYAHGMENAQFNLALNNFDLRDYAPAKLIFERCLSIARERGDALNQADSLHHLALIMDAQGDAAGSVSLYEELEALYRGMGYRRSMALVQNNLGYALLRLGQYERARRLFVEGLLIRREMGLQLGYVYSFCNFGLLAVFENKPARAAQLLGAAEGLSDQIGFAHDTLTDDLYLAAIAAARAALGETGFKLEWSRGRGLSAQQAIDLALGEK